MQSRANELIESLIPKQMLEFSVVDTHTQLSETPERPKKMLKNLAIVSRAPVNDPLVSYIPTHISVPVTRVAPALPNRSPLRPNKISDSSSDRHTVYSRVAHRAVSTSEPSAAPVMQPPSLESSFSLQSQVPVTRSSEAPSVTRTPTSAMVHSQNSRARIDEVFRLPLPPKSPLTVSKVAPPLIPVSMSDIDLDVSFVSC